MNCNQVTLFHRCKIILFINAFSGFCLTECSSRRRRKKQWWYFLLGTVQTLYEFSLNVAIFSMTTIVGWVVLTGSNDSRGNFAAFVNSIRGILFATYITFSSLFLRFGKRQLRKILREADNFVRMDRFGELVQEQCLLRASQRTLNMYFLLPVSAALFSIILNFTLTLMFIMGYYQDNVFDVDVDDKERIYSSIEPVNYIKILFFLIFCYLKQTAHDSIFLHLYSFIAEELSDLKKKLKQIVRSMQNESPQCQHVAVNLSLTKWIGQQQALAKLMRKINSFAYPYILVLAGYNSGILCITAYLFSKLSDSPAFKLAVLGYMMNSLLRISLFCEAGHRLKKQGLEICDVVYKTPQLSASPSFGLTLHSIALDCQRSFVARGGPFFTLSVEFFTSVVGAVLTYFVVLIQFK